MKLPVILVGPEIEARLRWGAIRNCPAMRDLRPGPILVAMKHSQGMASIHDIALLAGTWRGPDGGPEMWGFSHVIPVEPIPVVGSLERGLEEMAGRSMRVNWDGNWATITFDGEKAPSLIDHQS
jgi:hypothetical protein